MEYFLVRGELELEYLFVEVHDSLHEELGHGFVVLFVHCYSNILIIIIIRV